MSVVVSRLAGGLGNQLFQVAAGLLVSGRTGSRLALDPALISLEVHRSYALAGWQLPVDVELPSWMSLVTGGPGHGPHGSRGTDVTALRRRPRRVLHVQEGGMGLSSVLQQVSAPCVLSGFWQAWAHVEPVLPVLRAAMPTAPVRADVIGVHVRRGDFVFPGGPTFGAVPASYIAAGVALVRERLGSMPVRVWSDDPDWCRASLDVADLAVVEPGTADEDLVGLASCRAHVSSNSTFSWWGAVLAGSELVVAPDPWLRDRSLVNPDLLPPTWVRLPAELLGA